MHDNIPPVQMEEYFISSADSGVCIMSQAAMKQLAQSAFRVDPRKIWKRVGQCLAVENSPLIRRNLEVIIQRVLEKPRQDTGRGWERRLCGVGPVAPQIPGAHADVRCYSLLRAGKSGGRGGGGSSDFAGRAALLLRRLLQAAHQRTSEVSLAAPGHNGRAALLRAAQTSSGTPKRCW